MYIPLRRDDTDDCPQGKSNCSPAYAIIGQDPSEKENNDFGPSDYGKPGPHRFIGIGMVAGMVFLALVAYVAFGKRPKRMLRKCCGCSRRRKDNEVDQVAVVLETSSASSSSEEKPHTRVIQSGPPDGGKQSRKGSSHSKGKRGNRGMAADSIVRAGKGSEQDDGEHGNVTRWEVEHVQGVRYEVRTPTELQPDQRLEVHVQRPCLTHQR